MENSTPQKADDGKPFPQDEPPMVIEPLKPKRPSRTVREVEALIVGLQVGLVTELNATKEEILQAIREGQTAVEAIAREMVRRADQPADLPEGNSTQ